MTSREDRAWLASERHGLKAFFLLPVIAVTIAIFWLAQTAAIKVVADGGAPQWAIRTLFRSWTTNPHVLQSSEGNSVSLTVSAEPNEQIPAAPTNTSMLVFCLGNNRIAAGLVRQESVSSERGWKCRYWGAPVLVIPSWIVPSSVIAVFVGVLLLGRWRRYVSSRRYFGKRCPKCGYLLRGLPSPRCPECGTICSVEGKK